jgi:hypothetical protein
MISAAATDASLRALGSTTATSRSTLRRRALFNLDPFLALLADFILDPAPFFDLAAAATGAAVVVGAEEGAADGNWVGGRTGGAAMDVGFDFDAVLEPRLLPPLS